MHEFADEQSTALRYVSAPATFGVGDTVHAADAAEGVSSSAAVANKTRRIDRSGIWTSTIRRVTPRSSATSALSSARRELADHRRRSPMTVPPLRRASLYE